MYPTIIWRCSDEFEELLALLTRPSSYPLIHIPEKWNRSLDHMCPTHLSADDGEFTRIQERVVLMSREKMKNSDVRMLECESVRRRIYIYYEITRKRVPINTIYCRWIGEYGDMFLLYWSLRGRVPLRSIGNTLGVKQSMPRHFHHLTSIRFTLLHS